MSPRDNHGLMPAFSAPLSLAHIYRARGNCMLGLLDLRCDFVDPPATATGIGQIDQLEYLMPRLGVYCAR